MNSNRKPVSKPGFRLAAAATLFTVTVIMLGAFTRLVDAGLGCPDWPVCYGHILWPMEEHEIATANALFPDTPVEQNKTWPEQVHRIFASSLGLFCIALVSVAFVQRFRKDNYEYPLKLPLFLLGLVILQGLFGMWTVTLNLWPQVVTAHLMGGFATLSLLALLSLRLAGRHWQLDSGYLGRVNSLKPLALIALLVVIIQIILGGWTTSNYAALACPDFPACQTRWWPVMDFAKGFNITQHIGPNYLGGLMDGAARTAIHFSHRIGAIVVAIVVVFFALRLWMAGFVMARKWAVYLMLILAAQIALGISNVIFSLPLPIAVAHNAVGALLLVTMVALCHRLFTAEPVVRLK